MKGQTQQYTQNEYRAIRAAIQEIYLQFYDLPANQFLQLFILSMLLESSSTSETRKCKCLPQSFKINIEYLMPIGMKCITISFGELMQVVTKWMQIMLILVRPESRLWLSVVVFRILRKKTIIFLCNIYSYVTKNTCSNLSA